MIIYKTTNNINKKVYIGQTVKSLDKRKKTHLYKSTNASDNYLYRAIRKYGENNFKSFSDFLPNIPVTIFVNTDIIILSYLFSLSFHYILHLKYH